MAVKNAAAATVRAWASDNGLSNGSRGRLTPETVEAFNAAHKGKSKYVAGAFKATTTIKGFKATANGRKVPVSKRVVAGEVRAAALTAGVTLPSKGRIPNSVKAAYVAGTLGQ